MNKDMSKKRMLEFKLELFDYFDFIETLDDVNLVSDHALVMMDGILLRTDISSEQKVTLLRSVSQHAMNHKMDLMNICIEEEKEDGKDEEYKDLYEKMFKDKMVSGKIMQ